MKIAIVARTKELKSELKNKIKDIINSNNNKYIKFNQTKPDIVISYGGDGTFLIAERKYPSIPKLILKNNSVCKKCSHTDINYSLNKIINNNNYKVKKYNKIDAILNSKIKLTATNDFVIRNKNPYEAIRFKVTINNKEITNKNKNSINKTDIIGDGIIVSTSFGSTGYFNSITQEEFNKDIGIAFNNSTEHIPTRIDNNLEIEFLMLRNTAQFVCDNTKKIINLNSGDKINFKKSDEYFNLIEIK